MTRGFGCAIETLELEAPIELVGAILFLDLDLPRPNKPKEFPPSVKSSDEGPVIIIGP